jgi:hypothetical protein
MPEGAESLYALTFMNDDALQSGITYDLTIKDARKFYTSSDLHHHIFFASSMMFLATGKKEFRDGGAQLRSASRYACAIRSSQVLFRLASWDNGWFEPLQS